MCQPIFILIGFIRLIPSDKGRSNEGLTALKYAAASRKEALVCKLIDYTVSHCCQRFPNRTPLSEFRQAIKISFAGVSPSASLSRCSSNSKVGKKLGAYISPALS